MNQADEVELYGGDIQPEPTRKMRFICWFSRKFWDIHDYPVSCGGDGYPAHFYEYTCWNCRKRFGI